MPASTNWIAEYLTTTSVLRNVRCLVTLLGLSWTPHIKQEWLPSWEDVWRRTQIMEEMTFVKQPVIKVPPRVLWFFFILDDVANVQSVEECQQLCFEHQSCNVFTYGSLFMTVHTHWRQRCFLKTGILNWYSNANTFGAYSGPQVCPCLMENTTMTINPLEKIEHASSAENCQALCQDYLGCVGFSWVDDSHVDAEARLDCWLHGSLLPRIYSENMVSGPRYCWYGLGYILGVPDKSGQAITAYVICCSLLSETPSSARKRNRSEP